MLSTLTLKLCCRAFGGVMSQELVEFRSKSWTRTTFFGGFCPLCFIEGGLFTWLVRPRSINQVCLNFSHCSPYGFLVAVLPRSEFSSHLGWPRTGPETQACTRQLAHSLSLPLSLPSNFEKYYSLYTNGAINFYSTKSF